MATQTICDRCERARGETARVLDWDLCPICVAAMRQWVRTGKHWDPRKKNKQRGAWTGLIVALARMQGTLTPDELAREAGVTRERAHWQLNYHTRIGTLVRVAAGHYRLDVESAAPAEAAE